MIKNYLTLTKPGIIFGNVITAAAGFFLASRGHSNYWLFLATLAGLSLIVASACVFNNYFDRDIDKLMNRTKNRALAKGVISGRSALFYAIILGFSGTLVLALFTNFLTVFLALAGFFVYVVLYGIGKRRTPYGTVIGSISGAMPPVVGYCAVSNKFDSGAILLFLILVLWQMPHFYAIAIYRLHDYYSAAIPVLPVKKGIFITKIHMIFYIIGFSIAIVLLTAIRFTNFIYLLITIFLGLVWFGFSMKGFFTKNNVSWARKMFLLSLVEITLFCFIISVAN